MAVARKLNSIRILAGLLGAALVCALANGGFAQVPRLPANVEVSTGWMLQDIAKVSDAGDKISAAGYSPAAWNKATVPGTVLTSLVNDGLYPEPLYGENNRPDKIPESLCRTSYWYRTEVAVPQNYTGRRVWLNLEGINYTAGVWVNGKSVGEIKGAFARGIFDITDLVKPGQTAAIAVKINPPPHPGNPQEQTVANGTGPNGGDLMQDGPTFGCTVGWDWIPAIRDRDMGIWQKVYLSATGDVRIDNPSVSADLPLPRTDSADLTFTVTARNTSNEQQEGMIHGAYDGKNFQSSIVLDPHEVAEITLTRFDSPALHMINPKLWWPNTYGDPHLYSLHVSFDINGIASDARDINFGVRKITYQVPTDQTTLFNLAAGKTLIPPTDNLTISVNGVPIMCKGGCWGMDEAMKRIPADVLDAKVRYHQLANYVMIRNWVGQSTGEDFYSACDKYGILIWDEMFQANQSDGPPVGGRPASGDTPEALALRKETIQMYLDNAREKVVRFRSHPSIALWCGRNESNPAPQEVADGLVKLTSELDPARFYQPNSGDGRGVRSGGPYSWRAPVSFFGPVSAAVGPAPGAIPGRRGQLDRASDEILTAAGFPGGGAPGGGGRGRGGFGGGFGGPGGGLEPFKTELGSVSIPTLEAIKAMMPEKDLYDLNDDWAEHDLCRGAQQGNTFPAMISQRYGAIATRDLPDFVRKSQLAMYETYRAMYEGRMAKMFAPCDAVLTWMSNPSQPSFVWQIYSYDLEPLAALYGAQKGCEPLHIQMNANDFHVMVINSQPAAKENLQALVRVFNMDGTKKAERTILVTAGACAATDLGAIAWPEGLSTVHFITLELHDAAGKVLSDNFYWRTTAQAAAGAAPAGGVGLGRAGFGAPPEDFSAMETMPTAQINVAAIPVQNAEPGRTFSVTVSNLTKIPAIQIHLQLRNAATQQRILPVFYSENYVSLMPGESRTITIQSPWKNQGGALPVIAVDGWNVTTADLSKPALENVGVLREPNKDAFVAPKAAPATGGN